MIPLAFFCDVLFDEFLDSDITKYYLEFNREGCIYG